MYICSWKSDGLFVWTGEPRRRLGLLCAKEPTWSGSKFPIGVMGTGKTMGFTGKPLETA